jgi:hypothetical protein
MNCCEAARLPHSDNAVVDRAKIVHYLLNPAYSDNGGKAEFFEQPGFQRDRWEVLGTAFKTLAVWADVLNVSESPHGTKYILAGRLQSPSGKATLVQSVWIVEKGGDAARLVKAYPRQA